MGSNTNNYPSCNKLSDLGNYFKYSKSLKKRSKRDDQMITLQKTCKVVPRNIGIFVLVGATISYFLIQLSILLKLECVHESNPTGSLLQCASTFSENFLHCENLRSKCLDNNYTASILTCPSKEVFNNSAPDGQKSNGRNAYSIKKQLESSELIWRRSVAQRHEWIATIGKNNLSSVNPWDGENYVYLWSYFPPSFNCPHSVERVGFIGDGGKWVCGLEHFERKADDPITTSGSPRPCIIYSFGVANESSFEGEMLARTNCVVFAYDFSVKNIGFPVAPADPRVTFKALGIGSKNLGKFRTLKFFMEQNGHDWIDILKMDIEGGEYAALDQVMQEFAELPFGQLLLEVHVEGKLFPNFYRWWERLEERGLRPFQSEVNHVACGISMVKPNFVEYSFLNIHGRHRLIID